MQSRLHSKEGRNFGMILAGLNVPIMGLNSLTQRIVPPPKYNVDRLVECNIIRSTNVENLFVIERGAPVLEDVPYVDAIATLVDNTDDAYGFPPFRQMAPSIVIGSRRLPRTAPKRTRHSDLGHGKHPGAEAGIRQLLLGRRHRGSAPGRPLGSASADANRRARRSSGRRRPGRARGPGMTRDAASSFLTSVLAPARDSTGQGRWRIRPVADEAGRRHLPLRWMLSMALPVTAVLAVATFLRFWQLDRIGFNSDEAVYSGTAASIAGNDVMRSMFPIFRAHPLFLQILLSFGMHGHVSDWGARAVTAAIGVGTVAATYGLGRRLYGHTAGLHSGPAAGRHAVPCDR